MPFRVEDYAKRTVQAALRRVAGAKCSGEGLEGFPVGGGVATGEAFLGNVGEGEMRDFPVIGDKVNTVAQLQASAGSGESLVTDDTYREVSGRFSSPEERKPELKSKAAPLLAHLLITEGQHRA